MTPGTQAGGRHPDHRSCSSIRQEVPVAGVTMDKVTKVYPNGVAAVIDLDLDIADGEFLVLVGPSGCGKSTALRMVAGLETITSGELRIGDRVVNDLPPKDRDIAMVFQNYALYPHMTVRAEHRLRPQAGQAAEGRDRASGCSNAAKVLAARGVARPQARPAVRRPAPARGHGPGHRPRPVGVPDGRAPVEPRRQAAGPDAGRDRLAAAQPRHDHDLRHPRPDRGHDDG